MHRAAAIIPARYASQRLPAKPLLAETGTPLIVHVLRRASMARRVESVLAATDDARIADAVRAAGFAAVMTDAAHPNGTSRIAQAAESLDPGIDLIVNVQGDEPEIDPGLIDLLVERLAAGDAEMATIGSPFAAGEDPSDPNIVKVVVDQAGHAMYFSRSLIPFDRDGAGATPPLKHIGIYAYRRAFLRKYVQLPATPCEQAEKLEQLRALEHGRRIAVVIARVEHHGIDTPEQYRRFVERFKSGRAK